MDMIELLVISQQSWWNSPGICSFEQLLMYSTQVCNINMRTAFVSIVLAVETCLSSFNWPITGPDSRGVSAQPPRINCYGNSIQWLPNRPLIVFESDVISTRWVHLFCPNIQFHIRHLGGIQFRCSLIIIIIKKFLKNKKNCIYFS